MSDARGFGRDLQRALEFGRAFPEKPSLATISVSNHPAFCEEKYIWEETKGLPLRWQLKKKTNNTREASA
jgi:hypothetical protein